MNDRLHATAAPHPAIELERRWGADNYHPLPVVLTRGEGVWLWDSAGRRYLDMMSAYSAVSFGHGHPALVAALVEQAGRLAVTSRAFHSDRLGPFLERLCMLTGMDRALPMNSGAEAVETALKAARKWGYKVKGIAAGRARIVVAAGNFAGRTTTIVGFSSEAQYRDGFGPFAPGFDTVPFGDAAALEAAIGDDTCAVLLEPIQGEAGIVVPPPGYLRAAREICTRRGVLLICDEIQTGLGRTGRRLALDHEGVVPDGLTLGKALGGGLLPVSAFLARADVMAQFTPGDHGSTFGGNPLAAAVGLAALDVMEREGLAERAAASGERLMAGLRALAHPAVREVRGRGLLVGVELAPDFASARVVCEALMAEGVLTKDTHGTVVRLAPPLVIAPAQIDFAVAAFASALRACGG
ncbi:ornithine--oxo-acid transaminase [Rubrivivax gelatinosus]|uniref:ornithine aminotransferase n=1 Tax=Rubrivivax gelatinosus TaxID=28068 RepID=A0ABS1DPX9_RUBGE|nr:ornithine--oxo-acid transaminase [Rubrivivax gelatinosus]MBK1612720.1 ornithine--oxo-acid transaminase [Rubrivivax gelatinosus]MBK1711454.1 ornithine--oxo-acid transaminase [Rubrivivax gelatinosus]